MTLYKKRENLSGEKNILQKIISHALATCFLLIPESIDLAIKQQRQEHITNRIMDPDYLKQAGVESLQWIYEHVQFLGGPVPKIIEVYKEQGTISKTPCPRFSPGWYGRIILAGTDTIRGVHVYTMTYNYVCTNNSLIELLNNNMLYHSAIILMAPFSGYVYYTIVKSGDLRYAEEHILMDKMAKFSEKDEI